MHLPKGKRAQLLMWWEVVPQTVCPVPGFSCCSRAVSFCWWAFSLLSLGATRTHQALALPHNGSGAGPGPGVKSRAKAAASAWLAAERCALLQRGSWSWALCTQFNIALKYLNSLDELIVTNWLRFGLLKLMTKRMFLMSFLWISLLCNATVHFTQHFSWGQWRQTCLASGMLHRRPNYITEVLPSSLKDVFGGIWTSVEFLKVIDYKMRSFQMVLFPLQMIVSALLPKQIQLSYGRLGRAFSLIKYFTANQHLYYYSTA